jgi:DNA-binding LytR/AlgR family response regulator
MPPPGRARSRRFTNRRGGYVDGQAAVHASRAASRDCANQSAWRGMAKPRTDLALGPWSDWRGWARGFALSIVAGVFMAFSGAFGSGDMAIGSRLAYWVILMILGTLWGSAVAHFLLKPQDREGRWARAVLTAIVMAAPFTVVVALANRMMLGEERGNSEFVSLFVVVAAICMAMVVLNILVESRRILVAQAPPPPPKFLERLPLKLRGAEMWAVEAEDHYLRLHTSKGQDLILLRLADAVAELEGIEGMQVHRSWWVARDAITGAKRGDGRATLTLKDGAQVPVSRTFAAQLREKGWI